MPMVWLFAALLAVTAFFNLAEMALVAVRGASLAVEVVAIDSGAIRSMRVIVVPRD